MSSARYIGRVGALAVALGIGAAVANSPGLAHAEPDSTASAGATSESTGATGTGTSAPSDPSAAPKGAPDSDADSPTNPPGGSGPETSVSSSGGAHTSTHGGGTDGQDADDEVVPEDEANESDADTAQTSKRKGSNDRRPAAPEAPRPQLSSPAPEAVSTKRDAAATAVDTVSDGARLPARRAGAPAVVAATPASSVASVANPQIHPTAQPAVPKAAVPDVVTGLLSGLLGSLGFAPSSTPGPTTPPESPLSWTMLAVARSKADRESSLISSRIADTSGGEVTTSLALEQGPTTMAAAAVGNSAPVANGPVVGVPAAATGVVLGSVGASDPDGNVLSYSVTGVPANGKVVVNASGGFTYTPAQAARVRAGLTPAPDADVFSVTVSDGVASTVVSVSVPISPVTISGPTSASSGGSNPAGVVVVSGKGVYVSNSGSNTVTVLDVSTGAVVKTITVGGAPGALVASADGSSVWVANAGGNSVSRINTATNAVVATTQVGVTPRSLALAPNGSTVWVANAGGNSVSRISTTTNAVVGSPIGVGWAPYGIAVSTDGSSVFVANAGQSTVSRISTASNTVVSTTGVGSTPLSIAAFGDRVYTANQFANSVSVINTTTNVVTTVGVGPNPTSVTLSPDGSLAYVANAVDTVSVIDTRTNAVIRTITIDTAPENGPHTVSVSPDGSKVYVTDGADGAVRILSIARVNSAPVTGTPTVGLPDANGLVTGSLNVTDLDADPLTYLVTGQPANGSTVIIGSTGGFTFTPSATARNLAAQTPGPDTTSFTVRVTDAVGATTNVTVSGVQVLPAPVGNRPPTITYTASSPDVNTAKVTGTLTFSDPDGNPLTHTIESGPYLGTLSIDNVTGVFTYTPSYEARVQYALYPESNIDYFTVAVSDGTVTTRKDVIVSIGTGQLPPIGYGSPPEAGPASPATGAITGGIGLFDPNGDPITLTVVRAPTNGTVTVNPNGATNFGQSGTYTYTPNPSARALGGLDSFTIAVSDGTGTTNVEVTVPIRPVELGATQALISGVGGPGAVNGARAYYLRSVVSGGEVKWTVEKVDTTTNAVIGSSAPIAPYGNLAQDVAISPDGTRIYVANPTTGPGGQKVYVLDSATLSLVGTPIAVGTWPEAIAVNPSGTRLYVGNTIDDNVQVVDTSTRAVVATIPLGTVGLLRDVVVSKDGTRVYVAADERVSVIDAGNNTSLGSIATGTVDAIAVSPDGLRLYVANAQAGTVSVYDTAARTIVGTPIAVGVSSNLATTGTRPTGLAVSPDGKWVYVANGADVVVIDAVTRKAVGAVQVDQPPTGFDWTSTGQRMLVGSDGRLYVNVSGGVKAVSVSSTVTNRPPVAGTPSVGNPDVGTGAVSGLLNVTDQDGNTLTYNVTGAPGKGGVTISSTGGYLYTPSAAARANAAQTPGPDTDTFTVRVSDGQAFVDTTVVVPVAPVGNSAPVANGPVVGVPAAATGVVLGSVGASDPDGNVLSYSVTGVPANGKVVVNASGGFTYTPAQAARVRAGLTPAPDADVFSVTVSDGVASTVVSVSVPISPVTISGPTSASSGGSNPAGVVVVSGKGVYVSNSGSNTVTVLDVSTGAVVKTITVGGAPGALVASADGSSVWVANAGGNSVSRINTTTNAVVATTQVGATPRSLALAPNGSTVWVANTGSNSVSRISTTTNAVVGSPIGVGWAPYGISITPDGSSVFVANASQSTVSRISTASNTVVSTTGVGSAPLSIAAFGDRVYTANQFANSVSVINTTTNVVTTVGVGPNPTSVTLSPDGSLAYVANAVDTVSVIDTRTNAVIRTITIDTAPENGPHTVSVSPDGSKVYVTDGADGAVRILTIARVNSAPVAGTPTVGEPAVGSGVVTGTLNVTDLDGDALSYQIVGQVANDSTVTFTPTGGFTFTPSTTARNLALTSGWETATFSVIATDSAGGTATTTVTVKVAPPSVAVNTAGVATGNGPSGVVVTGGKVYVVNTDSNSVTVLGANNAIIKTITVGGAPISIAASPAGGRVYVSNSLDNTVSVIDTVTDTELRKVPIQVEPHVNPELGPIDNLITDLTVSHSGDRVYVTATDGAISVINTSTFAVTRHLVGSYSDLEIGADGVMFATSAAYGAGGAVGVIYPDSMTGGVIDVGPQWNLDAMNSQFTSGTYNAVLSPDGYTLYVTYGVTTVARGVGGQTSGSFITDSRGQNWLVTGGYSAVAVIDLNPDHWAGLYTQVATINVPAGAQDIALASDGRYAYVTAWDGKTVTKVDLWTNKAVGTYTTDQTAGVSRSVGFFSDRYFDRFVAVGPDGKVYVSDYADGKVYVSTIGSQPVV